MPFNAEQMSYAGKSAMDYRIRSKPEDLFNTDRPLLKALMANKQTFPGAKQYIEEKLRITNDSNFQWFGPNGQVSYNNKRTLGNANFPWASAHDGFFLTEEELAANYITMTDDRSATPTTSEKHQFVNLMNENTDTLMLGFKEKMDFELHLDGSQNGEALEGLDHLIAINPAAGTLGGIDRSVSANAYFRNQVLLNMDGTNADEMTEGMEVIFRQCTRVGGNRPNLILAGSKFYDAYRKDNKANLERQITVPQSGGVGLDGGVNRLGFKGVEVQWDPVLDDLQAQVPDATNPWDKRCYFLNTRFLKLRPMKGQDMITRKPPRVYDRYTHYWGLTWRGALTTNHPGSMAVLTIA